MRIRSLLIAALGLGCVIGAAAPASAEPWGYGHDRYEAWRMHEAREHARMEERARLERARWERERWEHRWDRGPYWHGAYVPAPDVMLAAPPVVIRVP